jgi:hypothetical protein
MGGGAGAALTAATRARARTQMFLTVEHSVAGGCASANSSYKDAKLAQKLSQLQPLTAVFHFSPECMANLHLPDQPNTFLASDGMRHPGVIVDGGAHWIRPLRILMGEISRGRVCH